MMLLFAFTLDFLNLLFYRSEDRRVLPLTNGRGQSGCSIYIKVCELQTDSFGRTAHKLRS